MKVVGLEDIRKALDWDTAIEAIDAGFRAFSAGKANLAAVGHLAFPAASGDCHVKCASMDGSDVFVVKVATGFYANPGKGLATSNGFMALLSVETGLPCCLLLDEGWLTDMRTAMAGAVAARRIVGARRGPIGIVGAGTQARLQAQLIAHATGIDSVLVWARAPEKAQTLAATLCAANLKASVTSDLHELCFNSAVVVTTTPSTHPLLTESMVPKGVRIIAVGADAPGKRELDSALVSGADLVVVDSRAQCLDHGEIGWASRDGLLDLARLVELGELLSGDQRIPDGSRVIVDLTGIAVQDLQIAKAVLTHSS